MIRAGTDASMRAVRSAVNAIMPLLVAGQPGHWRLSCWRSLRLPRHALPCQECPGPSPPREPPARDHPDVLAGASSDCHQDPSWARRRPRGLFGFYWTTNRRQSSGTPLRLCVPRSTNWRPEPATRSLTVLGCAEVLPSSLQQPIDRGRPIGGLCLLGPHRVLGAGLHLLRGAACILRARGCLRRRRASGWSGRGDPLQMEVHKKAGCGCTDHVL